MPEMQERLRALEPNRSARRRRKFAFIRAEIQKLEALIKDPGLRTE
jgi:hypothetical protein